MNLRHFAKSPVLVSLDEGNCGLVKREALFDKMGYNGL